MRFVSLSLLAILLIGCAPRPRRKHVVKEKANKNRYLMALAWYQHAGESRALFYQAFNAAKNQVTRELQKKREKKPALVFDLDETLLDNSPFQTWAIKNNTGYPNGWMEWVNKAEAKAIPGGLEFTKWAKSQGVELFYISNRKIAGLDATFKNMQTLGYPVKKENIMLRDKSSSKTERRAAVLKNYDILAYLGDNLADFVGDFEEKPTAKRASLVDEKREMFGNKFIVFPNPVYGDWEGALYKYNWKASEAEKTKILYDGMK